MPPGWEGKKHVPSPRELWPLQLQGKLGPATHHNCLEQDDCPGQAQLPRALELDQICMAEPQEIRDYELSNSLAGPLGGGPCRLGRGRGTLLSLSLQARRSSLGWRGAESPVNGVLAGLVLTVHLRWSLRVPQAGGRLSGRYPGKGAQPCTYYPRMAR
jgi:hypothetical protein